jgi:K+-transporting ATPase KdpF subunit
MRRGARGLPVAVRPGARMSALDVLAGIVSVAVFLYLLWALLRPEDF